MRVADVMTRDVITVDVDMPLSRAVSLLVENNVAALPVIGDDTLVGMISETDLLRHEIPHEHKQGYGDRVLVSAGGPPDGQTVADVMTTPVVAVPENADTGHVARLMLDYDVRSVPVVDGRKVTGIVSRRDLIRTLVHDDERIAAEVRNRLDDYSGEKDRWGVDVTEGVVIVSGPFDHRNERRVVGLLSRTVPGARSVRLNERPGPQSEDRAEDLGGGSAGAGGTGPPGSRR